MIEDEDSQEEEATLLKRAAAVHEALLTSLDLEADANHLDLSTLMDFIIKCTHDLKGVDTSNVW